MKIDVLKIYRFFQNILQKQFGIPRRLMVKARIINYANTHALRSIRYRRWAWAQLCFSFLTSACLVIDHFISDSLAFTSFIGELRQNSHGKDELPAAKMSGNEARTGRCGIPARSKPAGESFLSRCESRAKFSRLATAGLNWQLHSARRRRSFRLSRSSLASRRIQKRSLTASRSSGRICTLLAVIPQPPPRTSRR